MTRLLGLFVFLIFIASSRGDVRLGDNSIVRFANLAEGRQVLTRRDEFVVRLSSFDRSARMKTDRAVTEAEFLEFLGTNVMEIEDAESKFVERSLDSLKPRLESFNFAWPPTILIVKTTGNEEGGAAYTRGTAIVLPRARLKSAADALERLLCHELFHVLSRHNPELREKLYSVIGFRKRDEVPFPSKLVRITNPDAPRNDHYIIVKAQGKEVAAMPILFASPTQYDPRKGGEFFNYLQFKLWAAPLGSGGSVTFDSENPVLMDPAEAEGFFAQIGENTNYIIHPEEILASNFVDLIYKNTNVKSPFVIEKMRKALAE